jgi:RNA polymerase-binding protein DksA
VARFEHVKDHLEKTLAGLTSRVTKIESTLRDPSAADSEERATESENDEVLERLDTITLAEVDQLRQAIERIDRGTYGTCVTCGQRIGTARLTALPAATTCVQCASTVDRV